MKGRDAHGVAQVFQPAVAQVFNLRTGQKASAFYYDKGALKTDTQISSALNQGERAGGLEGLPVGKPAIQQVGKPALRIPGFNAS